MADFVAVIRKAVDGLANNTPENRAKVYDKARSAVVRQLENMKPRPPEELLRRQIAKLDAAIAEVDSEYAEALPALEEDDAFSPWRKRRMLPIIRRMLPQSLPFMPPSGTSRWRKSLLRLCPHIRSRFILSSQSRFMKNRPAKSLSRGTRRRFNPA